MRGLPPWSARFAWEWRTSITSRSLEGELSGKSSWYVLAEKWRKMLCEMCTVLCACNELFDALHMNSMKLVIRLHWVYWSIHTKDESKRETAFAFIFDVNWLCHCGVTALFGVLKCNGMMIFMEFMFTLVQTVQELYFWTDQQWIQWDDIVLGQNFW